MPDPASLEESSGVSAPPGDGRFDVFLSHSGADKPAVERIAEKLKRAGLEPWLDKWYLAPGGRWQDELAAALRASAACAVFVGREELGAWAHEELALARDRAAKDRDFRLIPVLLPGLPEPFDPTTLPAFLSTRTWVDFRVGLEDSRPLQNFVNAVKGVPPGPEVPLEPVAGAAPYRGLEVFDVEHAELFFGRDGDLQRLIEKLKSTRFLTVLGPSGSGKSSLVRAGLIPLIRGGALPASETWPIAVFRPGAHPLTALAAQLLHLHGDRGMQATIEELGSNAATLELAVALALARSSDSQKVGFVVDQFEEVFTLCRDEQERCAFVDNLLHAGSVPVGRTVVILTMRADFYARATAFPELAQQIAAHQFLVTPMSAESVRQAIVEPARAAGLELEAGLVETILEDVKGEPGALPLLEHALLELWKRRRGSMLTLEAYRETGGVTGALSQHAGEVWCRFDEREQNIGRRIFLRLTQPGEGAEDTRRRATASELVTTPEEEQTVEKILTLLSDERLLTTSRDEDSSERLVEVSHEALIRGWPRLRGWVEEDRQGLLVHRRLTEAAHEWVALDREPGALYRGARLAAAAEWVKEHGAALNPVEREFVEASRAAEASELEASKKRARRLRGLAVALGSLLVLAGLLAFVAWSSARNARSEKARADDQKGIALSRFLATEAARSPDSRLDRSILLSLEAFRASPTSAARNAVVEALQRSEGLAWILPVEDIFNIVASRDGRILATVGVDSNVTLWDVTTRKRLGQLPMGAASGIALAFSDDGGQLVSGSDDGVIRIWDVDGRRQIDEMRGDLPIAFDGRNVVAYSGPGEVVLRDVTTGARLTGLETSVDVDFLAFSPDGRTLALVDEGRFTLWAVAGDTLARRCTGGSKSANGDVTALVFSSDGRRIVTGREDGRIDYWDAGRCRLELSVAAHHDAVFALALGPGSRVLASAGLDKSVKLWDAVTHRQIGDARATRDFVTGLAFLPDGRQLVLAGDQGTVKVWDISGAYDLRRPMLPEKWAGEAAFSSDGKHMAIARGSGDLGSFVDLERALFEGASLDSPAPLPRDTPTDHVAFSPDGRLTAWANRDLPPVIRLLNVASRKPVTPSVPLAATNVEVVAFRPPEGGVLVVAGSRQRLPGDDQGWIELRSVPGLAKIAELPTRLPSIDSVVFSPDGTRLVAASWLTSAVELWDVDARRRLDALTAGVGRQVGDLAISPDGALLAGLGLDGVTRLWDLESRRMRGDLVGPSPDNAVSGLAISRDSRTLFSLDGDGRLLLWDLAAQTRLGLPIVVERSTSLAFNPKRNRLVTVGARPAILFWDPILWSEDLAALAWRLCPVVGRDLTVAESQKFVPGEPRHATCRPFLPNG